MARTLTCQLPKIGEPGFIGRLPFVERSDDEEYDGAAEWGPSSEEEMEECEQPVRILKPR